MAREIFLGAVSRPARETCCRPPGLAEFRPQVAERLAAPQHAKAGETTFMRAHLAAIVLVLMAAPAAAGRPLTEEETLRLTAAMAEEGCSGGEMAFDDGKYEVDNAVCSDGRAYDLAFDARFRLIKKEREG
jgi:Peptidase propeptide and YPEB domain